MNKIQPVVLAVEDEAAIRDMITLALERACMNVRSAANAHEALLSICKNPLAGDCRR